MTRCGSEASCCQSTIGFPTTTWTDYTLGLDVHAMVADMTPSPELQGPAPDLSDRRDAHSRTPCHRAHDTRCVACAVAPDSTGLWVRRPARGGRAERPGDVCAIALDEHAPRSNPPGHAARADRVALGVLALQGLSTRGLGERAPIRPACALDTECRRIRLGRVFALRLGMVASITPDLLPGTVVGSYRIEKEIGRGGMGKVFQATHCVLPRKAAIKVMHAELCRQPGMATRMVQEAAILEDVRHPGLVRVFECNLLPDHRPFIAMELVDGESLTQRLGEAGRMPWQDVATLLADVADVLAAVHARGVVHRDLKPDNLLLTPRDPDFPLRLIDWGIARLGPIGRLTMEGMTPGTPIYMSPEQAAGRDIAAPCDIYSLGVIAYEALAGQPPFDGRTLAEVVCKHITAPPVAIGERCSAPEGLCELVHGMLDKDPSRRPIASDIRRIALDLVRELEAAGAADDEVEITIMDDPIAAEAPDAVELEFGVTEMLPTMRKPRWTPQLESPVVQPSRKPITPRGDRDLVSGEIVSRRLLR